jgi:hypothetical protein
MQSTEKIWQSAEVPHQISEELREEATMIQERAREIKHMSQLARQRRKKQRARLSIGEKS